MKTKKLYLKRAEVMRRLGITAKCYRVWVENEVLKPRKLGKSRNAVFYVRDIEALVNGGAS